MRRFHTPVGTQPRARPAAHRRRGVARGRDSSLVTGPRAPPPAARRLRHARRLAGRRRPGRVRTTREQLAGLLEGAGLPCRTPDHPERVALPAVVSRGRHAAGNAARATPSGPPRPCMTGSRSSPRSTPASLRRSQARVLPMSTARVRRPSGTAATSGPSPSPSRRHARAAQLALTPTLRVIARRPVSGRSAASGAAAGAVPVRRGGILRPASRRPRRCFAPVATWSRRAGHEVSASGWRRARSSASCSSRGPRSSTRAS